MASNPYVNRVEKADGTAIIDISDTTATAADVASGKYFYTADGAKTQGTGSGGGSISIVDTQDAGGGIIRTITAETVSLQAKTNISPTTSSQTITPDDGYTGLSSVQINAMPTGTEGTPTATKGTVSNNSISVTPSVTNVAGYISGGTHTGTAVTVSASELVSGTKTITSSGDTDVTNYATASVAAGTAGTPTASKGTVSNHSVSVTPSVTNTTGYITGSTKTGTAVTVSASELVSGNKAITSAGNNIDVANYSTASVAAGSATAPSTISGTAATVTTGTNTLTLTKTVSVTPTVSAGYVTSGTAGNSSVSLTANVTTQAAQTIHPSTSDQTISASRYLTGAQTIKAVTLANLTADNIKQGVTVTVGDSTDDDCVASVTGTYSGGGDSKNAQIAQGFNRVAATTYTAVTGQSIKVSKTGSYDVYWTAWRTSTSGTSGTCLYVDNSAHTSGNQTTWDATYTNVQSIHLTGVSLTKDQTITVRARSRSTSYYTYVFNLTIIEA